MRDHEETLHTAEVEIPATIYPGMFDREYQVSVRILGKEVTVIVSRDEIHPEGKVTDQGAPGRLRVSVVGLSDDSVLIDLPGETLGSSRRFKIPRTRWEQFAPVT